MIQTPAAPTFVTSTLTGLAQAAAAAKESGFALVDTGDTVAIALDPKALAAKAEDLNKQAAKLEKEATQLDGQASQQKEDAEGLTKEARKQEEQASEAQVDASRLNQEVESFSDKKTHLDEEISLRAEQMAEARADAQEERQNAALYRLQGVRLLAMAEGEPTLVDDALELIALADSQLLSAAGLDRQVGEWSQLLASLRGESQRVVYLIQDSTTRQQYLVSEANRLGAEAATTRNEATSQTRSAQATEDSARKARSRASDLTFEARRAETLAEVASL